MSLFFTADTHFGHEKIILHSKRPFANVQEMDEVMIERWNKVVRPWDDVWHLGDFNFRSALPTADYLRRLHGRIHIVWGNHDDAYAKKFPTLFQSIQDSKYLKWGHEKITLYHYAQRVWRNSHHGAWHLFGHSHGCLPRHGRSMDVGVDAHQFTPVSFEAVKEYMDTQGITHHHPETVVEL